MTSSTSHIHTVLGMKRSATWSLQLYSPYIALGVFLVLVLTAFNYINLASQQTTLMARNDQQQKEKDLLEVTFAGVTYSVAVVLFSD